MTGEIPTHIWLDGQIRRLAATGVYATVIKRGNPASGTLILQCRGRDGHSQVYTQARDAQSRLIWLPAMAGKSVADSEADAYIQGAIAFDADAWAVEVEWNDPDTVPFEGQKA